MSELPHDLVPLPTAPYSERPAELPLDVEECRTAIWLHRGNISNAAKQLKVSSQRLRVFVRKSPRLAEEIKEAQQQLVDIAEDVAYEALTDNDDAARRDQMARYIMTNLGRERGYGDGKGNININNPKGPISISWADGVTISGTPDQAKVIEGSAE